MRAELNRMGLRKDPLSEQLLRALPWVPRHARRCAFSYLELISRFGLKWHRYPLSGAALAEPAWRDVISLRTQLIDGTISELKAEQLVILGAGFDARALLPLESAARRFEVDLPPTQKAKVAAINAAEIDAASTSFVPVDFSKEESWLDKLREAGFDPKKKTVFVWEGAPRSRRPLRRAAPPYLRRLPTSAPPASCQASPTTSRPRRSTQPSSCSSGAARARPSSSTTSAPTWSRASCCR